MLLPLFLKVLQSDGDCFEYIDTVVNMIAGFTYYGDSISLATWSTCGPLLFCLNEWAIDYVSEMMVPILNFMTKVCLKWFYFRCECFFSDMFTKGYS
jgi:hypothetical protein